MPDEQSPTHGGYASEVDDLRAALADARALAAKTQSELLDARDQIRTLEVRLGHAEGSAMEFASYADSREQAVLELDRMHNSRVWKAMMTGLTPLRRARELRAK